jgi:hypothetical protein
VNLYYLFGIPSWLSFHRTRMSLFGCVAPVGRVNKAIAEHDHSADATNRTASCPTIMKHYDVLYHIAIERLL